MHDIYHKSNDSSFDFPSRQILDAVQSFIFIDVKIYVTIDIKILKN